MEKVTAAVLILLVASINGCSLHFGETTLPPSDICTACPTISITPMPDLPVATPTKCPDGSNLELCFDKDNSKNLKDRITILHDAAKDCHTIN